MTAGSIDAFLHSVRLVRDHVPSFDSYPFHLPLLQNFETLRFHPKVTFLIGENGVGKSTLMEAIAVACRFDAQVGPIHFPLPAQAAQAPHSNLHQYIELVRGAKTPKDGFFFRGEQAVKPAAAAGKTHQVPSHTGRNGNSAASKLLDQPAYGESFYATFLHRFRGNGLYILDEPEATLSPLRQMALLSRIHALVKENAQFVISTRSPILLSYPDSMIYEVTADGLQLKALEETAYYLQYREFREASAQFGAAFYK